MADGKAQFAGMAVMVAMRSFGSENLISTTGGPPPYGHRKFTQGRLVATKRLLAKLPRWDKKSLRICLDTLAELGHVRFSGRGRHAGWTLTEQGWNIAEADVNASTALAVVKSRRHHDCRREGSDG